MGLGHTFNRELQSYEEFGAVPDLSGYHKSLICETEHNKNLGQKLL